MTRIKEVVRNAVMGGKLFHVIVLFGEIEYVLLIYLHQTSITCYVSMNMQKIDLFEDYRLLS